MLVARAHQRDPRERAERDDQLQRLVAVRDERHEAVAGLGLDRRDAVLGAVAQLDLDDRVPVLLGEALDAAAQPADELLRRADARDPQLAQKSDSSGGTATPRC